MLIVQHKRYALGNFINMTPAIKKLSEKHGVVDVYFNTDYVKQCFLDCPFINIIEEESTAEFSSNMFNYKIPDYKYIFKEVTGERWTNKYHTYVDEPKEHNVLDEDYLLIINGLGGLSVNPNDPKPYWYGKKELNEKILLHIKKHCKLPVVFTGSESDLMQTPWISDIADRIEIGNIRKSLALVKGAKKIISNDTGLAHCAGAMNKSILILWKDTPFVKNKNPGIATQYAQKNEWFDKVKKYLSKV